MTNSANPDQLAFSEAKWSGSTLFAKAGHDLFSKKGLITYLISASNGLMNGDPLIVCVLTMWSSKSSWISSTDDKICVPVSLYEIIVNSIWNEISVRFTPSIWTDRIEQSRPRSDTAVFDQGLHCRIQQNVAFDQGLHCLLLIQQFLDTTIYCCLSW